MNREGRCREPRWSGPGEGPLLTLTFYKLLSRLSGWAASPHEGLETSHPWYSHPFIRREEGGGTPSLRSLAPCLQLGRVLPALIPSSCFTHLEHRPHMALGLCPSPASCPRHFGHPQYFQAGHLMGPRLPLESCGPWCKSQPSLWPALLPQASDSTSWSPRSYSATVVPESDFNTLLAHCSSLRKLFSLPCLGLLICKMGTTTPQRFEN